MLYSEFITKLRLELKDLSTLEKDTWDGDGSVKLFQTSKRPIKDGSYVLKVGGATQTETTHYTIDKDLGLITLVSAPTSGSDNVELTYRAYVLRDDDYIEIINDGIDHFRWKFWNMDIDTTTLTTVKDQYEYDCSGITGILYILKAWYKTSTGSTYWQEIQGLTNWKYYTRLNKLYIDPTLTPSSLPMKLLYLKSFTKGTATDDTLDIPDEWILPYKYYVYARYYERLISEKIHETAAITTQPSYAPAQLVYDIAQKFYEKAETIANKIAPKLPPMMIKQLSGGVAL